MKLGDPVVVWEGSRRTKRHLRIFLNKEGNKYRCVSTIAAGEFLGGKEYGTHLWDHAEPYTPPKHKTMVKGPVEIMKLLVEGGYESKVSGSWAPPKRGDIWWTPPMWVTCGCDPSNSGFCYEPEWLETKLIKGEDTEDD